MNRTPPDLTTERIDDAREWLHRAMVNAKSATILAEQGDEDLLVEAVSQVQQACEKATKAVMIGQGIPYDQVKESGHNTIGAFTTLIAEMLGTIPQVEDVSKALLTQDATKSARLLTKVVLSGKRNKATRDKVLYAWKQVLPESAGNLGNRALEVEQWQRLTRAFPPPVVGIFIEFHEAFKEKWRHYINALPNTYADPRPLLSKIVSAEAWVFGSDHAGLPRRFSEQQADTPINSIMASLAQQLLNDFMEQFQRQYGEQHWPETINIREVLLHISRWLSSLGWLFLCATVTTPHATSSRYPADGFESKTVKGSQHYTEQLGVVACIGPLAIHTHESIRNLTRHYRDVGSGYRHLLR